MTHREKLDTILREIDSPKTYEALKKTFPDNSKAEINHHVLNQILEKLRKDGLAYFVDSNDYVISREIKDGEYVRRTFDGDVFIEDGGYVEEARKAKRTRNLQSLATWVTAIGTGLTGLYVLWLIGEYLLSLLGC